MQDKKKKKYERGPCVTQRKSAFLLPFPCDRVLFYINEKVIKTMCNFACKVEHFPPFKGISNTLLSRLTQKKKKMPSF